MICPLTVFEWVRFFVCRSRADIVGVQNSPARSAGSPTKLRLGEVVERPASVVKEVLENALDAQLPSIISIDIEAGGVKRDSDYRQRRGYRQRGSCSLALARHATSKIASIDDLEAVATLGFSR